MILNYEDSRDLDDAIRQLEYVDAQPSLGDTKANIRAVLRKLIIWRQTADVRNESHR